MPPNLDNRIDNAAKLLDIFERRMSELAHQYASGEITLGTWQITMRQELRTMNAMMLITAAGGNKDEIDSSAWLKLGSELSSQYGYLEDFAHFIAENDPSEAATAARANLYAKSTQATFWRQVADELGIELPAVPGDGDSECLTNCKCQWEFDYTYDDQGNIKSVLATWKLGETDSHCPTCNQHAAEWSPLEIQV